VREVQQVLRAKRLLENDANLRALRPDGLRAEDIGALLGMGGSQVSDLLAMAESPRSLDSSLDQQNDEQSMGDTLVDELTISPENQTQAHEVDLLLSAWVGGLSAREREIIESRFGLHDTEAQTLEVISARMGMTKERVRQVQNEALSKLKRHFARQGITRDALI
jgi:RNA polymerase nonessential primary-like sigma factor